MKTVCVNLKWNMNKLADNISYDKALRKLKSEFGTLMNKYLKELHVAFHEDNDLDLSHNESFKKARNDCISIFSNNIGRITFDDRSEEEVIKEILEYNFDMTDIKHMKDVKEIDLFSHLGSLNRNCIIRTDPEWFQFSIHELQQEGKVDLKPIGSGHTQFCKCCGEQIYILHKPEQLQSLSYLK